MARTLILGRSGVGKSWYLQKVVSEAAPNFQYSILFDYEGEFLGLAGEDAPYKSFYIDPDIWEQLDKDAIARILKKNRHIRVEPEGLNDDEVVELFADLCVVAMDENGQWGLEDKSVFVTADECQHVAREGKLHDDVSRLATGGRKYLCEWCFSTQRPQLIDKSVLSQTDYAVCFQVRDRDADKAGGFIGVEDERLTSIPERRAFVVNLNEGNRSVISTDKMSQEYPHVAGDDGAADDVFESHMEQGEEDV